MVSETNTPIKRTVTGAWIVQCFRYATLRQGISELTDLGVAKGTISKIETVFTALTDGTITEDQVTSLNAAYDLVKHPERATLAQIVALVNKQAEESKRAEGDEQYVAFFDLLEQLQAVLNG